MNDKCKACYIKKFMGNNSKLPFEENNLTEYPANASPLPPMGWSSWNTFRNYLDEKLVLDTANAVKNTGLYEAGYRYINLDDCWHSSMRDSNGEMQGDLVRFPSGIKNLVKQVNDLGLKLGIYSSNGVYTCEELPASLYNEEKDALTFVKWGVEYLKYDYCHNIPYTDKAPYVYKIDLFKDGKITEYPVIEKNLEGEAYLKEHKKLKNYVKGMDKRKGGLVFEVEAETDGEYVLTIHTKKAGRYDKFLIAEVNKFNKNYIIIPPQKIWNLTYRYQLKVNLNKGKNTIKLYNPIENKIYSAYYQYKKMGEALISAVKKVYGEDTDKNIVYSICEWGRNKPWVWGKYAGNLWRTTPDIRPIWIWMMYIYNKTINLAPFSEKGGWNDPDMLEVGNGKLTYDQNKSHFSLWCMMNAPLILGNDLRKITDDVLKIVTNKNLISINQDLLCKSAKRIIKGKVDTLIKPLSDGVALCFFNKRSTKAKRSYNLDELLAAGKFTADKGYSIIDMWSEEVREYSPELKIELKPYECIVLKIYN